EASPFELPIEETPSYKGGPPVEAPPPDTSNAVPDWVHELAAQDGGPFSGITSTPPLAAAEPASEASAVAVAEVDESQASDAEVWPTAIAPAPAHEMAQPSVPWISNGPAAPASDGLPQASPSFADPFAGGASFDS